MSGRPFQPGDVLVWTGKGGTTRRYVVLDPPRTSGGKLRTRNVASGAERTSWWYPGLLPEGWRLESDG